VEPLVLPDVPVPVCPEVPVVLVAFGSEVLPVVPDVEPIPDELPVPVVLPEVPVPLVPDVPVVPVPVPVVPVVLPEVPV